MRTQLSETSTSGFVLNSKGDQNQLATLDFVTISDYFVKDLAKCLHVFPSWFCALITIIIAKLKQNVIRPNWFNMNIFYKHGISCILVIVHRILREYQNWTELKLTHEWSCENKLYLQSIRMLYKQRPRKIKLVLRSISWITILQCSVLMSKIRREILCW